MRHPMYAGVIPMYFCTPLALGSFWVILTFIPLCAIIILRTLNEEEVLNRDLPGYRE
ncbi:MAG: methyltransferase family protein [Thermodesulfobacteriota bacterium]